MKIVRICDWVITVSFYILFFLIPLLLTPFNYELFEYNKMMAVYGLTVTIGGSWFIKMVISKQLILRRTPLDIPIMIYLITQLLSYYFSIDRHVSLWGYYSRFHGGLLSTICYLLLYYALVTNIDTVKIIKFLKVSLLSLLAVSIYGILEHFGIDKNVWVQDVQNRVFSTLGQPNWLAAYLVILIPVTMAFALNSRLKVEIQKFTVYIYYLLFIIYYLCLLYTKSRSGLLAFGITFFLFWLGTFWLNRDQIKSLLRPFFLFSFFIFLFSILVGTPWTPRFQDLFYHPSSIIQRSVSGPALETGGTESSEIRKIVWKGALDIARHYPLFGSGVETFAFSYYQFRPAAHNLVSEWDFLYNKAHNEYLNYAATTGFVGLGAYLLLIGWFLIWFIRRQKTEDRKQKTVTSKTDDSKNTVLLSYRPLELALFAGYASILITNFFGFSVVMVAIYFWLIPAMVFVSSTPSTGADMISPLRCEPKLWQKISVVFIIFSIFYFLFSIIRFWYADTRFNRAYQLAKAGYHKEAFEIFHQAINLNPNEPFYHDELSYNEAVLAVAAFEAKEASLAGQLTKDALYQSKIALSTSPLNVTFWKTRTKVFYTLADIDEKHNEEALDSLLMARRLAPTDAKISYNVALLYGRVDNPKMAIKTLENTVVLKPDYRDARYALALYYKEMNQHQEAIGQLEYILTKISTDDAQAKEKLKEWQ